MIRIAREVVESAQQKAAAVGVDPQISSNNSASTTTSSASRPGKNGRPGFHTPGELVTFSVGEESSEEVFKIHKEFICYHSPVLKAAFNNDRFVEGDTQTYRLDDIRPSCFRLFTQWVYTQDFDMFLPSVTTISAWPKDIAKDMAKQDLDFAQLWVLGDKFLIHHLQNKVIDKFYAQFEAKVPLNDSWFRYAYENTSDSSPLRKYAVDHMMRRGPDYKKRLQQIPCEMFLDLVQSLIGWDKNPQMILNTYYVKVTT